MEYGLQLFSVRDFCDTDMDYAFSRLQEFGYGFVEFSGFYDNSCAEIKALLDKYNFGVCGAHVPAQELKNDFKKTVDFHLAIGNRDIIIPSYEVYTKELVYELVDVINKYQPMLEKEGMRLHYHNHDNEFKENKDAVVPFDILKKETDVLFEIDTFWTFFAGKDPVELIRSLGDRVKLMHIKDGLLDRTVKSLGEGCAPVEDCVKLALELGLPVIVESEGLCPDGLSEVKRCSKFLKKLDLGGEKNNG